MTVGKLTLGVEIIQFVTQGERQVVRIIAFPQLFDSEEMTKAALKAAVDKYKNGGKPCSVYDSTDNPFEVIIVHGINS